MELRYAKSTLTFGLIAVGRLRMSVADCIAAYLPLSDRVICTYSTVLSECGFPSNAVVCFCWYSFVSKTGAEREEGRATPSLFLAEL